MKESVLYEVYPKSALHRGIAGLVRLHWSRNQEYARQHARDWGGCVVKLRAVVHAWEPLRRDAPTAIEVVYVAPSRAARWEAPMDVHQLRGLLMKGVGGRIPRYKRAKG